MTAGGVSPPYFKINEDASTYLFDDCLMGHDGFLYLHDGFCKVFLPRNRHKRYFLA